MKNKSKLMLVATSLLTVSIAASATSAFAWYTINRTANVNLSNIEIKTDHSSLAVEPVVTPGASGTDFVTTGEGTGEKDKPLTLIQNAELTNPKTLSDVTSNGNGTYNKPKFSPDGSKIIGWYNPTQAGNFALSLQLKFTASSTNNLQLYLKNTSTATDAAGDGPLASAQNAFRFSVKNGGSVVLYGTPYGDTNADATYLKGDELGTLASDGPAAHTEDPDTSTYVVSKLDPDTSVASKANLYAPTFAQVTEHTPSTGNAAHGYLAEITKAAPVTLTFNFWIEGTDPQCVPLNQGLAAFTDALNINLDFYAVETEPGK